MKAECHQHLIMEWELSRLIAEIERFIGHGTHPIDDYGELLDVRESLERLIEGKKEGSCPECNRILREMRKVLQDIDDWKEKEEVSPSDELINIYHMLCGIVREK